MGERGSALIVLNPYEARTAAAIFERFFPADEIGPGARKTEKSKKRTVYAPRPEHNTKRPAVISVELDEDEDVEWTWMHTADGKSVVTGCVITKRTDNPRRRRGLLDNNKGSSSSRSK